MCNERANGAENQRCWRESMESRTIRQQLQSCSLKFFLHSSRNAENLTAPLVAKRRRRSVRIDAT